MKTPRPKTMLIIEDDAGLQTTLAAVAQGLGYETRVSGTADEGLKLALEIRPTLIFCDVFLDGGDGRAVLRALRVDKAMSDCQFVLMTGDWVGASQRVSVENEADVYLAKPFTVKEF